MKLHIAAIGKPHAQWAENALDHYSHFLKKYGGVEFHFVQSRKITKNSDPRRVAAEETKMLIKAFPDRAHRIFIDRTGKQYDSEGWAENLERVMQRAAGPVGFIIGGALGLDLSQKQTGDEVWSLSTLTFPHELALVILCEQLARGLSILRGDSYHK